MARIILVVTELLEGEKMLIIRVENNEVVSLKQAMSCDKELSDYIKQFSYEICTKSNIIINIWKQTKTIYTI